MLRTTTTQDTQFAGFFLRACIENEKIASGMASFFLWDHSNLFYGEILDRDPQTFEGKLKRREFHKYCEAVEEFLTFVRMCTTKGELVDQGILGPAEIHYVHTSRFGRLFLRLHFYAQWILIYVLDKAVRASFVVKRYRWIATFSTVIIGITGWNKTHHLSGLLVLLTAVGGVFVAWITALLADFFGTHHDFSDDP